MDKEALRLASCLAALREKTDFVPEAAVVLGSGLGGFAEAIRPVASVPYGALPDFPVSTAPGHAGRFVFGYVEDTPVAVLQGRVHLYEGYSAQDAALPVRLMGKMGAKAYFVTNACGGIRRDLTAGKFMLLRDHLSCFVPNPLRGENDESLGPRFPDMTEPYDLRLCALVKAAAEKNGIPLSEGVYAQFPGPCFETPAEIRMLERLGADAVGMSTVVEVVAARHCGLRVCGISFIANVAAGLSDLPLSGQDVLQAANEAAPRFQQLLWDSLAAAHDELKEN